MGMLWSEFGPASSGGWGWLLGALRLGRDGKTQLAMAGAGWRESHWVLMEESEGG